MGEALRTPECLSYTDKPRSDNLSYLFFRIELFVLFAYQRLLFKGE